MRLSAGQEPARPGIGDSTACRFRAAVLAVLLAVAGGGAVKADGPSQWRLFRAADGLSESLSTAITVSPRGNVWVKHGEVNAISGLDGYSVQRVPAPPGRIYRVHQSRAGRVWAAYEDGLLGWDGEAWTRHPLTNVLGAAELIQFRAGRMPSLVTAEADRVILVLPERLVEFRGGEGSLKLLWSAAAAGLGRFTDVTAGGGSGVWLTGEKGLARFVGPLRQLGPTSVWNVAIPPAALRLSGFHRPFEDDEGGVTMLGEAGGQDHRVLVHFEGTNWLTRSLAGENVRFAWRAEEPGVFWGVSLNRLVRFEPGGVSVVTPGPPVTQIFDVAVQPRGIFWLATREGLLRRAPSAWRPPDGMAEGTGLVAGFTEDAAGLLWMATESGLLVLEAGAWRRIVWPAGFEPAFQTGDGVFDLGGRGLLVGVSARWWRFAPGDGGFEPVVHPEARLLVRVLYREAAGGLVVLTRPGPGTPGDGARLELFDGTSFSAWTEVPPLPETGGDFFFLERARSGDWWLGTSAGPAWGRDGRWQMFGAGDGYSDEGALCWLEVEDGRVWCAGLGRLHEFDGRRWTAIRSELDHVNVLRRAGDGSVWVAANNGLHRYYREAWLTVGREEGLPSPTVHAVFEDRQRQLWAGTLKGPVRYHPRADFDPPRTLSLTWEQQGSATGEGAGLLRLTGRDRWAYTPDERLVYAHRLDAGAWSAYSAEPTVRLRGLPQGRHRVEVRAMDRNWNVELRPQLFAFRVSVPWYRDQRVVAALVAGLVLALVAAAFAFRQHLELRRSYADVELQVEQRTRELRRATDALAHSQKMTALGTLAAGVAHDFNNILSIIKGSAQIIAAQPGDREKILTRVSRILTMVDQASDLVKAMLGFGTATEREVRACDLNRVVAGTVGLLSDRFRREVEVELRLEQDLPPVLAAADLVRQMMLNLIFNGADAMDGHGTIIVRSGRLPVLPPDLVLPPAAAAGYAFVSVTDHGTGIAPEIQPRIFEPFFTTKAMSSRPGRGLGLYMVYEFSREMNHGLRVESVPGQGSTFTLVLPLAPGTERGP